MSCIGGDKMMMENTKQLIHHIGTVHDNDNDSDNDDNDSIAVKYQNQLKLRRLKYLIGSDLIYAKEGIESLVDTYRSLATPYYTRCYLVYIKRFQWETQFFTLM